MTNASTLQVATTNSEQADDWDGVHGEFWATHAAEFETAVEQHWRHLFAALDLPTDARVLDVGCGTGRSTCDVARVVTSGSVLGVDLSSRMLELARRIAAAQGLSNARFEQADAQIYPFPPGQFDVILGHTSTMFFGDKPMAFANLASALRLGGQLALIVWQSPAHNPWFTAFLTALAAGRHLPTPPPDGSHPFSMADPDRIHPVLEVAGFTEIAFASVEEPMYFGPNPTKASEFTLGQFGWLLADLDDSSRQQATSAMTQTLQQHTSNRGVEYPSATWLITARRI